MITYALLIGSMQNVRITHPEVYAGNNLDAIPNDFEHKQYINSPFISESNFEVLD